jgi:hypothetical protein
LDLLRAQGDVEIWGEAVTDGKIVGRDRYSLQPSEALAIWTTPPGPAELREALGTVSPGTVFLFGIDPEMDAPQVFLRRLAGLAKRALRVDQGRVTVSALAAATAQRESTVRAGLAWLAARGHVAVLHEDGDEVRLVAGSQVASPELSRVAAQLKAFLEETAAYRAHFARADAQSLVQG